jgi:hypothetical protein
VVNVGLFSALPMLVGGDGFILCRWHLPMALNRVKKIGNWLVGNRDCEDCAIYWHPIRRRRDHRFEELRDREREF